VVPAAADNQLLLVNVFSDDSRVIVPSRYVSRAASVNELVCDANNAGL
jgi:hypothetical protein